MSCRLAFVLGAVVFLLSGCGDPRPIPPPAVDENAHHTPPEAYGCEVGDPIDNCKWEFPARGGAVTVEAVRRERGLSVTVEDKVNGCRHKPDVWAPNLARGSGRSCVAHCCIITKGTVLEAVSELRTLLHIDLLAHKVARFTRARSQHVLQGNRTTNCYLSRDETGKLNPVSLLRMAGTRPEYPEGVKIRYEDGKFVRVQYP